MNHPFLGNLSDKSMDELSETISTLNNRLQYMFKLGKHDMVRQITMIIEGYKAEYAKRQRELWEKKSSYQADKNIDIS
jgi:hypothetical protein